MHENLRLLESAAKHALKLKLFGKGHNMGFSLSRSEHRALCPQPGDSPQPAWPSSSSSFQCAQEQYLMPHTHCYHHSQYPHPPPHTETGEFLDLLPLQP